MTHFESSESTTTQPKSAQQTHPDVHVFNEQNDFELDTERYRQLAMSVIAGEGVTAVSELSVTFVSPEAITVLNEQHMGHEGPTDVLAFPIDEHSTQSQNLTDTPLMLGDVVVCPSVAADNCSTNKGSYPGHQGLLRDEIDLLVVHGVLHVLGMDHAEHQEKQRMQQRERLHLANIAEKSL